MTVAQRPAEAPAATPGLATHEDKANAIRVLAMDAVEAAQSGHPGMPMGMADVATVLFSEHLRFDSAAPDWPDRDRFVLSAGHGSMLQYALLYLTGYADMTVAELERFRQLSSRTAGHPEYGLAAGIETTTGPLGQGLVNAVGMALAEAMLRARFGAGIVDHHTYVIAGDGCLMEGISHEAASLAGHLGLGRLVCLFDDNRVSIDGPTALATSDDVGARFRALGWHVQAICGHDPAAASAALAAARAAPEPSLIQCRTTIAFGAPTKAGTAAAHGAPLGTDEIAGTRAALGWPHPPFHVPAHVLDAWRALGARGAAARAAWEARLRALDAACAARFHAMIEGRLPDGWDTAIEDLKRGFAAEAPKLATRQASGQVLETLTREIPNLIGGSADLTGSNNTKTKAQRVVSREDYGASYVHYGVREHAMGAVMNGLAVHGGFIPYGGTFLIFTDYARPAIRLSALMGQRVIYVMTHDSIGLGEDGPTHQPVEHLASLRAMPGLQVFRPADAVETAECWALALASADRPSVIALTRQAVATVRTAHTAENLCARGAYELAPAAAGRARVCLFATGSEVGIAVEARARLEAAGIGTRVVSVPCWSLFEAQGEADRAAVLGTGVRVGIEAAAGFGWERILGQRGAFVGMTGFGASAPGADLYRHFGITAERVVEEAKRLLGEN